MQRCTVRTADRLAAAVRAVAATGGEMVVVVAACTAAVAHAVAAVATVRKEEVRMAAERVEGVWVAYRRAAREGAGGRSHRAERAHEKGHL